MLPEALVLVLVVLAGLLEGRAQHIVATLPALDAVALRVGAASPRDFRWRAVAGWRSLRRAWEDLHRGLVVASEYEEGADESHLRALLQGEARRELEIAILACGEQLVPPCPHPDAQPVPEGELEQYLRGLPEEGRHDVQGEDWHRTRHAWLVLVELLRQRDAAPAAAARGLTRAVVRTKGTFFPYVVAPSLEGEAFGERARAHRFESFAAAGEWVDRNGGILMPYTIEPAPEDVLGPFTGQPPVNSDRETDPAPPSAELLAETGCDDEQALRKLHEADRAEAEILRGRAGADQCG
jgi:hypothetical protein